MKKIIFGAYIWNSLPLNYTTWMVNFSELRNPKMKPKIVAYEALSGVILSPLERAVDFINKAE